MVGENYSPQQQKIQGQDTACSKSNPCGISANRFFHGSAGRRGGAILCLQAAFLSLRLAGLAVAAVLSPPGER